MWQNLKIFIDYIKRPLTRRAELNILFSLLFILGLMAYFNFFHSGIMERKYLTKIQKLHYQSQPIVRTSRDLMSAIGRNISDAKNIEENIKTIEGNIENVENLELKLKKIQPPPKFRYLHSLLQDYYGTLNIVLNSFLDLSQFSLEVNKITTLLEKHPLVTAIKKDFNFEEAVSFQRETSSLSKEISSLDTDFKFTGQIKQNLLTITDSQIEIVDNFINFQQLPYEMWLGNIYSKTKNTEEAYKSLKDTFINLEKTPEIYENIQKLNELNSKISQTIQLSL